MFLLRFTMAEIEDKIGVIKKADYIDELEAKVQYEVNKILSKGELPRVTKKYKQITIPDFGKDLLAKREWQMQEIERCKKGYDNLPGKYYFYFNHCNIKHKERGKIRPDFRTMDLEWFKFLERIQSTPGKGIVSIKRRQVGMSWKASADVLYDCQFNRDFDIGMNSKSENDSRNLFTKVKYIYRNQSDFLRVRTSTDRRDALVFAVYDKDEFGNNGKLIAGTESSIISTSPVATAHAGNQYKKLILDEAGETETLEGIWSNAEDCLMQETIRVGCPIIFGTMGQTDKAGLGLKEFWLNHKNYDLEQFAFWGYNELIMDDLGNDELFESVRWIIYTRRKKEGGSRTVYNKFIQKYPLNETDAFLTISGSGVGNPIIINQQEINIMSNPPEARVGRMKLIGTEPHFEPNPQGHVIIYELPKDLQNGYRGVLDPAEDDDVKKSKDSSDLGFTIAARPYGLLPMRLAVEYCHRPLKLEDAYVQFALLCKMYRCKITIEMNKGGWRAFKWFEANYPELLELSPKAATNARGGVELKYGVRMTADRKNQMEGLLNEDIDNNCLSNPSIGFGGMPSKKMLAQYKVFGSDHEDDDLAVSYGWQLILNQSDKRAVKQHEALEAVRPIYGYQRVNGVIQIMNSKGESMNRVNLPNHPLFRK